MSTVQTRNAGEVNVKGGKEMDAKDMKGIKDDTKVVTFRNNERIKFKFNDDNKHAPGKTVVMHVLDAAIAEKLGKGKQVGDKIPVKDK